MSSRIRKQKLKNIELRNKVLLEETKLLKEAPNCAHEGYCTAAISCGGTSAYHGCCSNNNCNGGTCNTEAGGEYSDYIVCSGAISGGGNPTHALIGTPNKDIATKPTKPTYDKKPMKKLKEGCGCGEQKETSEGSYMAASQLHSIANKAENMYNKLEKDEVLDDWMESHLAKIDQMMDSVNDSFEHDEYKDMGDMGTGGCPPGHHWCTASNSCRADNAPQTEPLTLMGADVINLEESNKDKLVLTEQSQNARRVTYKTCNGSTIGHQNNVTTQGQVPQPGDVIRIFTNTTGYGSPRTVMVLGVSPNLPGYYQLQNAPIQPNCPNCNAPCFNWTTMQNCNGTTGDPDCVISGNSGWSPNIPTIECGSCNQPQPQGDWWCDPTGAYVNPNGGNCVQSPNQPQSYFTGPYMSEADCNAQCSTTGGPTPKYVTVDLCDGSSTNFSQNSFMNMLVDDNGTVREPVVGDEFEAPAGGPGAQLANYRIVQVGTATQVPQMTFPIVPCPNTQTTGCDQSAWSGYSTWLNNFTSLPNFSSSNPNQPCQFLCQRNTLWGNALSTGTINGQQMGPNWMNQIQCKYDEVQDLMNTHNCSSSNAPAC